MSRTSNFSQDHPYAKARGWVGGQRAGSALPRVSDGVNEVDNASEILVVGGTVSEPEDGVAQISFGGLSKSSNSSGLFPGSAGTPVLMRNNASIDLRPGDVVIVDSSDDSAVTTTSTASNTKIVGVVQQPIGRLDYGPVLFNGLTTIINTAGTIARGNYALTSATAARAAATAGRVSGSFGVYLTGTDLPDFVQGSAVTEESVPVESLEIDMPGTVPEGRVLFLALWLEDDVTSVSIDGWTQIGNEAGYYYFYKVSEGDDAADATWSTASPAVACVLLLHPNVSLSTPVADHDYDSSTSAASVSGLSDVPRYAIAGVASAVTSPGSGFIRLGGGSAVFNPGGSLSIVQEAVGDAAVGVSFANPVSVGNLLIAVCASRDGGPGGSGNLQMVSVPGVVDPTWTNVAINAHTNTAGNCDYVSLQAKIATSTSAGPFLNTCTSTSTGSDIYLFEVAGIGVSGVTALSQTGGTGSPLDIGSFTTVGANDLVIFAGVWKNGGDPGVSASGYTEDRDAVLGGGHPWFWIGHRSGSGGTVDAELTHSSGGNWAAVAGHFVSSALEAVGTLAGKYIGHASSATSPFSGGAQARDAIFAVNLLADANPSALLYGPDLGSEPTADAHISDSSDAHDASAISFDATGLDNTDADDVQEAIADLDVAITASGGGGGNWTMLSDSLLGSDTASFDFTSISGSYKHLAIVINGRSTRAGQVLDFVTMRFNNDSGSNYDGFWMQFFNGFATTAGAEDVGATSFAHALLAPAASSATGSSMGGEILISNYAATTFNKNFTSEHHASLTQASGNIRRCVSSGEWRSTAAITRVTIAPANGNWKAGSRATLYGLS